MTGITLAGTRQQGQGDHGSLARANTFNNMAAHRSCFKRRLCQSAPAGNADMQPTLAHMMKMKIPSLGRLRGRVMVEVLAGGPATVRSQAREAVAARQKRGLSTVLMYQVADDPMYLDEACFTEQTCH